MQTKRQIQQLLASAGIGPNKRLGQNFLIDLNLMRLLVDTAEVNSSDCVLEIGCGTGSLTALLAESACKVIGVEIDAKLADIATVQLSKFDNVEIINTDILENKHNISSTVLDRVKRIRSECPGRFLLVANLPYSAACSVMMNLVTGVVVVDGMYVTIQKEVAERMIASVDNRHYGTLSIFLSATGKVKMLRVLKPSVFWPRPEVDSAMVSFVRDRKKAEQIVDIDLFCTAVNFFMCHRRKMLKSSVQSAEGLLAKITDWSEIFERCNIEPTKRPGQISPQDYIAIANEAFLSISKIG